MYWFRTPAGVRIGRAALDEDAIRLIEEHHPDIEFDWPQILNGEEESPTGRPLRDERRSRPWSAETPRPPSDRVEVGPGATEANAPMGSPEPLLIDPEPAAPAVARQDERMGAAHARLGSEALARLRGRHADILAGLGRRVADEQRREQLRQQADRLNPDAWVTDDEVTAGLEDYEAVLASLQGVIGRPRRRRRGAAAARGLQAEQMGDGSPDRMRGDDPSDSGTPDADIPPDQ